MTDACDLFLPLAEDKRIALHWVCAEDAVVHGDRRALQRLLTNLRTMC